jgi:Fe-S cluster assembly iron-binding protein IscA
MAGGAVRPQFVPAPLEGDEVVEAGGVRVFVARTILDEYGDVEIDVTQEHESLMVRSLGSK